MAEFRKLVSPSLTTLFVEEITKNILSNKLRIGDKLPNERELSRLMKVSRAVIKAGIARLAAKGFVAVAPRKGVFVADYKRQGGTEILLSLLEFNNGKFDPPLLDSLYEIRRNMEGHIVRLAAQRRTSQDIAELRDQLKVVAKQHDAEKLAEETFKFYHLLAVASGNLVYPLSFYSNGKIYIPLFQLGYRQATKDERLHKMRRLVDLIEKKDVDGAVACALDLVDWGRSVVDKHYGF